MKNRRPISLLIAIVFVLTLQSCYLSDQAAGQFDLVWNQIPIEIFVKSEANPEFKRLLNLIPQVKQYGEESVKLKKTDNYSGYFETDKKGITFVVTASHKYQLEPYTWWFPIIGSVPYKGYFKKAAAIELSEELQNKGYDTWLFAAPAYSTLGWFKDPVTTPMLKAGTFSLVETILHEMSHTTIYLNNQGDFNEQLATFVGQIGAEQFFMESDILSEKQLLEVKTRKKRSAKFNQSVNSFIPRFQTLYEQNLSQRETQIRKENLFQELISEILKIYPNIPKENWKFNNARLLQFRRYKQNSRFFEETWAKSGQDWAIFWDLLRQRVKEKTWKG